MANWRLTSAHYLNVEGIEWDYAEQDQQTRRMKRVRFAVPLHLDPRDSSDWTDKANEWIVVSDGNAPMPRAIVFAGDPTPDMEPLDADAERIMAVWHKKWDGAHPIESLPGQGYSQSLLTKFQDEVNAKLSAMGGQYPGADQYAKGVDPTAFEALQSQVAELAKQNSQLIALLTQQMNKAVPPDRVDEQRREMADADRRA